MTKDQSLRQRLKDFGQTQVLTHLDQLPNREQAELLTQLENLNLSQLKELFHQKDHNESIPSLDQIQPVPVQPGQSADDASLEKIGQDALRGGQVAALMVAGGQGSRLGFEHPKGMYPVGPVSRKTLFQIHSEKILAIQRRYHCQLPFLIMTSHATDAETRRFFDANNFFGLRKEDVHFFSQGTMPALDLETGQLLLEAPGRLFLSPNGHGGTLTALNQSGYLSKMASQGVEHFFYFQVDNPLVKIADPLFLGRHLAARSELSSKVIPKLGPTDKLGNFVQIDGRCQMIEYSDLPEQLARQTDSQGRLLIWAGNPAIHIFDRLFLERMTQGDGKMPFHFARKKVPYLDSNGKVINPTKENALKFELFIFDVLPQAQRWILVETTREEEFAPLKNATGPDSPKTVEKAISDLHQSWLIRAKNSLPNPDGVGFNPVPVEISPLFALDGVEFAIQYKERGHQGNSNYFAN